MDTAAGAAGDGAQSTVTDPVLLEALRLRELARFKNTLTVAESLQYAAAIAALRGPETDPQRLQKWIARRLDMSRGRVAQILTRHRALTQSNTVTASTDGGAT